VTLDETKRQQLYAVFETQQPLAFALLRAALVWQVASLGCLMVVFGHTVAYAVGLIALHWFIAGGVVFIAGGALTLWRSHILQQRAIATMREIAADQPHTGQPDSYDQQHGEHER
jgi:zinc transporter ZupT